MDYYYLCESGFIPLPQKIAEDEIERYKFKPEKLFNKIIEVNNMKLEIQKISFNSYLLGEKGQEKYFYVQSINTKKLAETIYSLKEHCLNYSCHIITPQDISLKEADSALLEKHRCRITNLSHIIKNDFRIKTDIKENISLYLNANTRSIILYDTEIFFGKKLQPFKFIYELSKTPLEKVSCETLSGYKKSHSYDKAPAESARKTKERLLKFLNTKFLNQGKDISILKELITSFNQEGAYCLNIPPDKIDITGSFQK